MKASEVVDPAPLQSSVANARAEADLSSAPSETLPPSETPVAVWTLAERWANNADTAPLPESAPAQVARSTASPEAAPPASVEDASHEGSIEIAAGTIALLGLATVLMATLVRRRNRPNRDWHFAQRRLDGDGVRPSLTDLNDAPLMTWRKTSMDALRLARQTSRQPDVATRRFETANLAGSAVLRRRPTSPPAGRA